MRKPSTTFSALLLLGGVGTLGFLWSQLRGLSLRFDLRDEDAPDEYC
ncbi:hypothetical protein [Hymenobacter chitinivorans]|uniref:Uncharacterized protein n=1 Tax=Hymenobacter chitinivorans DSM 11115 TaxID=1121954 RepID=A0A2M9BQP8_9BACT|nr:hypothetical protein [Hymenobacter chitinivorans]PJJ60269.1 hypothetical protein CLV45_1694 [Hymenobacter chitinivorans DSM 11115]